jgi:hypothetical protein
VISPDGKERLTRSGRGPQWEWGDASAMAEGLRKIAARYRPQGEPTGIPAMHDFRVSLNVASCDGLPLVAAIGGTAEDAAQATSVLEGLAWSREMRGRLAFAPPSTLDALRAAGMNGTSPGILVIEPDLYGQTGKILARLPLDSSRETVGKTIKGVLSDFKSPIKEARSHIMEGRRRGVVWKTAIPVTDPNVRRPGGE